MLEDARCLSILMYHSVLFDSASKVELLHPIASRLTFGTCARCPHSFDSIFSASVTLFQQIVAGDNWGQISIPVLEEQPWTAILMLSILITISLGMLNLILAAAELNFGFFWSCFGDETCKSLIQNPLLKRNIFVEQRLSKTG